MIPWRRIAELPDALKDGREVLVWDGWPYVASFEADFWRIHDWIPLAGPTHFAEIDRPPEDAATITLSSDIPDLSV
ncbi:hypothetical protein ABIC65_001081 [Sphingomonas trueperi]|uniref:hypothetical protein n=1 Tax=Sphingomonas trueperi TaxID=53317 RepID=UPI003393B08C